MRKLLAALGLCLLAGAAHATTYVYTGPLYTSPVGSFTTSMRITGSFTTAVPLPANMPLTDIGPAGNHWATSWSFSDGIHAYTNSNSYVFEDVDFQVATDASGNITDYVFSLFTPLPPVAINDLVNAIYTSSEFGIYQAFDAAPCIDVDAAEKCTSVSSEGATGNVTEDGIIGSFLRIDSAAAAPVPMLGNAPLILLSALLGVVALHREKRRIAGGHRQA